MQISVLASMLSHKKCISCLVLSCLLWQLRPFVALWYWKSQLLKRIICLVILTVLGKSNISPFQQTHNALHHYCFYRTYKKLTTTHFYKTDIPLIYKTQHSLLTNAANWYIRPNLQLFSGYTSYYTLHTAKQSW